MLTNKADLGLLAIGIIAGFDPSFQILSEVAFICWLLKFKFCKQTSRRVCFVKLRPSRLTWSGHEQRTCSLWSTDSKIYEALMCADVIVIHEDVLSVDYGRADNARLSWSWSADFIYHDGRASFFYSQTSSLMNLSSGCLLVYISLLYIKTSFHFTCCAFLLSDCTRLFGFCSGCECGPRSRLLRILDGWTQYM